MAEDIKLNKQVYNKEEYKKVINTSFNELGVTTNEQLLEEQPTVEDFFKMYNELFYEIPEIGENSHEFLIETSSEYIDFDSNDPLVEALQAEIASLRLEILELNQSQYPSET